MTDDLSQRTALVFNQTAPTPAVGDRELAAMAVVGECCGWGQETDSISGCGRHDNLFRGIPARDRFNRWHRDWVLAVNLVRKIVLQ